MKPNLYMPVFEKPEREGYIFKGIYSEKNGSGFQYYTDNMTVSKLWNEGDSETLYVYWIPEVYTINYVYDGNMQNPNPTTYTVEDEITLIKLNKTGYDFNWNIQKIEKGTVGNLEITGTFSPISYKINYYLEDWKGNGNPNPTTYTIEDEIEFRILECDGYSFEWAPIKIEKGTYGDLDVFGKWTPNRYRVKYEYLKAGTVHSNPDYYTYGETLVFSPATLGGYFVTWYKTSIPAGTMHDVTVTATYVEKSLDQCYNNGVYELWTWNQVEQLRNQPNGGFGRSYKLMKSIYCDKFQYDLAPINEFRGTLDGNGFSLTQYDIDCSQGGNLGLFKINYGTIKNLTIGSRYSPDSSLSNVNVGFFAGINKGTISNCHITASFNRSIFRAYFDGDSYAGGIVGYNEGTIENCTCNDRMEGRCNMGLIAGKNSGTIRNCRSDSSSFSKIEFNYRDYNACLGGIVGLQTAGQIINCYFKGKIQLLNDYSNTHINDNRVIQPCAGIIIGRKTGGTNTGNSWDNPDSSVDMVYDFGHLRVVTWKKGLKKYTHDQKLYFRNEECGRVG